MAAIVFVDQLSKWLIVTYLPDGGVNIIKGVFRFTYVENRGAAFGMLSNNRWVFLIVSTLAIILLLVYMFKWRPESKLGCIALSFIIGGGVGNMIDRVLLGYVIDFLDFCAFPKLWMWVFNVADAFVCVGAGLLILYLILETVKEVKAEKAKKELGEKIAEGEEKENEKSETDGNS